MFAHRSFRWTHQALGLAAWLLLGSAAAQPLRLGSLLQMAKASDAQYAAARAAFEAGREKLPQAEAANRPQVNLSFNARQNRDGSSAYSGSLGYDADGATLTVTQALFRLANKAGTELAELQVQLAQQQLQAAEQDLLLRVARGYFDVLQAQDELAAANAQKEALTQQLTQARRSFEVGLAPITEFNEAQSRHDLGLAQEIAARGDLAGRSRVLEKYIARPLAALARLSQGANVAIIDEQTQDDLLAAAPRHALPVLIGRTVAQIAQKEIERREAGHHPTLDLVATMRRDHNVNFGAFGGSNTRQVSVGVELAVPLYQGGLVSSRVREALAELQKAQQELSNAERQARLDAQQSQLGVVSGAALTRALNQALKSSETQLRSTQRGQQVGLRTLVDVLNAEQQLYITRKDLASARYRTLLAGLQLRAAAGALTEADLRMLDSLLGD